MSEQTVAEVVLFTDGRGTRPALVLSSRVGEVSHLGKGGEPLLTLAVKKLPAPNADHKKPTPIQVATAVPEVEIFHDVVHASHEFSKEFKEKKGIRNDADVAAHRGHGEWREFPLAAAAAGPEEAVTEGTEEAVTA